MSDNAKNKTRQHRKHDNPQSYRFRRVLGDILRYLNRTCGESMFDEAKEDFGHQLHELVTRGFTWGYIHTIPIHQSDFKSLNRKEWAAIRAIVRKYTHTPPEEKRHV